MKSKFGKIHQQVVDAKSRVVAASKKCKAVQNEIMNERILLEKGNIEEAEESLQLRRMEDTKLSLQKDLEFTEQKEIMAKFELAELRRIHEELKNDLEEMKNANTDLVEPVLNNLKQEVRLAALMLHVLLCTDM